MKKQAPISVIIPTYQHASTIGACLESIFAQSLLPEEVIVIDDGSTDHTKEILRPYEHRVIIIHQENQGNQRARNKGFDISHNPYVIFCDADIVMRSHMLEKMYKKLQENPQASYAYCRWRFFWKKFSSFPFDSERLRKMNFIHTTSLIRREHFPGFDVHIKRFQDWDVWLSMLEKGRVGVFIDEELFSIQEAKQRIGISHWLPKYAYRIPWGIMHWKPKQIDRYEQAREIIFQKHGINH